MTRLLKGFEQRIGCRFRHRFSGFDHHHAAFGLHRLTRKKAAHSSDLLQAQLRRGPTTQTGLFCFSTAEQTTLVLKGGFHPEQIRMVAFEQATPLTW